MESRKEGTGNRGGKAMKIEEAKSLSLEEFSKLEDIYGGFDTESSKNQPIRKKGESFMEFAKKGSEKIKNDPVIKKILE